MVEQNSSRSFPARRAVSTACALALVVAALALPRAAPAAAPKIEILERKVISHQPEYYHGWSTVTRRQNGELWLSWSGGRVSHVCPFGQVQAMMSRDDGATWTWPMVLLDSPTDDRDSGVLETAKGTLLVTTFTSIAYEDHLEKGTFFAQHTDNGWKSQPFSPEQLAQWRSAQSRLGAADRKAELGEWAIRSTDGGRVWSPRIATVVNSPHGPIQLRDGRLLYAGKQLWTGEGKVGVAESTDDGLNWRWLAAIPTRKGDRMRAYHELHVVEAGDGALIAHIRNHNEPNKGWTLQTESRDGGRTWSEPHPITYGFPSHLQRLRDGRLLMSYGYRRPPYGNRARLSSDNGRSWSDEVVISDDGKDGDLGYPSTVQLGDGSLLTVWYESRPLPKFAVLRQAKWRVQ